MNTRAPFILFFVSLVSLASAALADQVPDPPGFDAKSYVLMDYQSGQVLAAHEGDSRVEPASLTKLMTVYIAFDELKKGHIKLEDEVLVSEKAWREGIDSKESRMFIEVGKRVPLGDLLHGIVIQSGNDASIAIAEYIAGSEDAFASLMNQYAKRLGLARTHYTNATGVPDPNLYTTAYDVALLSRALIRDFPEHYALFKGKDFVFNKIKQQNRNLLLWRDPTVDGIKTGHHGAAGYCLAASALRDGRRLITVVMGTPGTEVRAQASLALLSYGFRFFETVELAAPKMPITTVRTWKGAEEELALGVAKPLVVSIPRGARAKLQIRSEVMGQVFAPVATGQPLGTLTVSLDGKTLRSEPLVALKDIPTGNLWRRMTDEIRLRINGAS